MPPPSYAIAEGSVIEVQVLGTLFEQRTRTVFHYLYTGTTDETGPNDLVTLLADFDTVVYDDFRALQSANWHHDFTTAQVISPTRYRAVVDEIDEEGGGDTPAAPPSVAVCIKRQGVASGRKYQGRVFIPGVPIPAVSNGKIEPGSLAGWEAAAANLTEPLTGAGPADAFVPIVHFKPPVTTLDTVVIAQLDPILRSQRRREIGVGE